MAGMMRRIRELLLAQPFVPFTVLTSGGKQYRVPTPDHASIDPRGTQVAVWFDNGGMVILSALHLVGVERDSETAQA